MHPACARCTSARLDCSYDPSAVTDSAGMLRANPQDSPPSPASSSLASVSGEPAARHPGKHRLPTPRCVFTNVQFLLQTRQLGREVNSLRSPAAVPHSWALHFGGMQSHQRYERNLVAALADHDSQILAVSSHQPGRRGLYFGTRIQSISQMVHAIQQCL